MTQFVQQIHPFLLIIKLFGFPSMHNIMITNIILFFPLSQIFLFFHLKSTPHSKTPSFRLRSEFGSFFLNFRKSIKILMNGLKHFFFIDFFFDRFCFFFKFFLIILVIQHALFCFGESRG